MPVEQVGLIQPEYVGPAGGDFAVMGGPTNTADYSTPHDQIGVTITHDH